MNFRDYKLSFFSELKGAKDMCLNAMNDVDSLQQDKNFKPSMDDIAQKNGELTEIRRMLDFIDKNFK